MNSIELSYCERRCYDLLVKIEKEISWEILLKIKSATFLIDTDNSIWENPYFEADQSKPMNPMGSFYRRQEGNKGGVDQSVQEIRKAADKFIFQKRNIESKPKHIETISEEDKSEYEETMNAKKSFQRKNRKPNLDNATIEDKQVTFATVPDQNDENNYINKDMDDMSEDELVNLQTMDKEQRKKRICNKIDKLFLVLFEDLNLLCDWETDEKNKGPDEKTSQCGVLWINRGILAERLNRKRLAERAYRNGIEQGFSLYAWSRLLKIYAETYNPKACLVCMAEILDQAEEDGLVIFHKVTNHCRVLTFLVPSLD